MLYSGQSENQTRGDGSRRHGMQPALDAELMERVVATANVSAAWKRVKRNGGKPGVDGVTIEEFPSQTREQWQAIRQAVLDGTYEPTPVLRKEIPKPDGGGKRELGIPIVLDRVICQSIQQTRLAVGQRPLVQSPRL